MRERARQRERVLVIILAFTLEGLLTSELTTKGEAGCSAIHKCKTQLVCVCSCVCVYCVFSIYSRFNIVKI